jgi:hypothetical protein
MSTGAGVSDVGTGVAVAVGVDVGVFVSCAGACSAVGVGLGVSVGASVAVGVASCASIGRTVPTTRTKTNINKLRKLLLFMSYLRSRNENGKWKMTKRSTCTG